jgi:Outer membrane cobalamin receptor protein
VKRTATALLGLLCLAQTSRAHAQTTTGIIRGTVRTGAGVPVPRVNIIVERAGRAGVSGPDGRYVVARVAPGTYTVRAALIGFAPSTKSVVVSGGDTVTADFELTEVALRLSEVITTGYRTQTRASVTGSIAAVSAEEFRDVPADNLSNALAGRLSGVSILQNAGTPGRESSIKVRAAGTFNNSDPLYVIDGVVSDKFAFDGLAAEDVDNVSVLKDGAAASIYGSRAPTASSS